LPIIELDGDVHVPMYEKFEAELEELKKKEDTKGARAEAVAVLRQYRRFESNLLKVLELQFQRWALAVLWFCFAGICLQPARPDLPQNRRFCRWPQGGCRGQHITSQLVRPGG